MTPEELLTELNLKYGYNPWPETYEVDTETYALVTQALLNYHIANNHYIVIKYKGFHIEIATGFHGGLMFKNVELLIKRKNE